MREWLGPLLPGSLLILDGSPARGRRAVAAALSPNEQEADVASFFPAGRSHVSQGRCLVPWILA
jgi:hypothetical protein